MHDGYVTMHDILSEALPVVPVKAYSKPEYVGMTKMLSDSGPSLQTGQPAGHVVYTALPTYARLWPPSTQRKQRNACAHQATLIGNTRWCRE